MTCKFQIFKKDDISDSNRADICWHFLNFEKTDWSGTMRCLILATFCNQFLRTIFDIHNNYNIFAFAIVHYFRLIQDSNSLGLEWKSLGQARQAVVMYGGIQVLRHYDFDLFWPTHPLYHQTSSFPIPTLMMTSSFPHTHPPINIFFPSLFNKLEGACFYWKKKPTCKIIIPKKNHLN